MDASAIAVRPSTPARGDAIYVAKAGPFSPFIPVCCPYPVVLTVDGLKSLSGRDLCDQWAMSASVRSISSAVL